MTTPRHSRVIRAEQLTERHFGRWVRVGQVVGELITLLPMPDGQGVHVIAIVGGARAEGVHVHVWIRRWSDGWGTREVPYEKCACGEVRGIA